ncbi:MAG: matrixin family metalloprotease [Polyangiales bacterium]
MRGVVPSLLVLALLAPRDALAWCRTTTVSQTDPAACVTTGAPLRWPVRCVAMSLDPRTLPAGMTAPQVRGLLGDAVAVWGASRCDGQPWSLSLSVGADATAGVGYLATGSNENAVVFVPAWTAMGLPPSALALTTLTFGATSGEIRDADLQINLTMPLTVATPTRGNDLPTILLHELGHVIGLDHSPERSAVMWYAAGRGEQRRALGADDLAGACAIHPPSLQRPCAPPGREGGCACATAAAPPGPPTGIVLGVVGLLALGRRRRAAGRSARC